MGRDKATPFPAVSNTAHPEPVEGLCRPASYIVSIYNLLTISLVISTEGRDLLNSWGFTTGFLPFALRASLRLFKSLLAI